MPNQPPYTISNPLANHTPALSDVTRKPSPLGTKPLKNPGGTLLTCECGFKWYTVATKADGSYALANTAYQGHAIKETAT